MDRERIIIKVSVKSLQLNFVPCTEEYIREVCHGKGCKKSGGGIMVTTHPFERERLESLGAIIYGDFILADSRGLCPFFTFEGLCTIHEQKPFGCHASPYKINRNNTLIVRNRFRMMPCFRNKENQETLPVYEAHSEALSFIFGEEEAKRIIEVVKSYTPYNPYTTPQFFEASLLSSTYDILMENELVKIDKPYKNLNPKISLFNEIWGVG